ncbi:MAG: heme o synthase [Pirellulaceae bacterium]
MSITPTTTTTPLVVSRRENVLAVVSDYVELCKLRIGALVLITVGVSGLIATWGQPNVVALCSALGGTLLVAASASTLNQWLERSRDALMPRTADRPLPAGRISQRQAILFAVVTLLTGLAWLAATTTTTTTLLGLCTWVIYVWIYTPMKARTPMNTAVGAVSGALPVLMGWTAAGGSLLDLRAAALFLTVFLWQFPHFMAIAWMYRRQYARGGMQMATVVDPSGRSAGLQAVLAALALLPVSFVPAMLAPGASWYLAAAFVLGAAQLLCAVLFFIRLDDVSARRLLRASLVYLPVLLIILVLVPLI